MLEYWKGTKPTSSVNQGEYIRVNIDITPTILIVEDSPTQATIIRRSLKQEGYNVVAAKNGVEGLETLENHEVDLIVCDVEMPRMNGYEFSKRVKTSEEYSHLPIIIVTSLDDPKALIKGVATGADNYLTKPFDDETLLCKVREMLDRPIEGNYFEDPESVSIKGEEFDIFTSKEHILKFLLTTYENVLRQNKELKKTDKQLSKMNKQLEINRNELEDLLYNIMPESIAESLMAYGSVDPIRSDEVSVMFTDFVSFSDYADTLSPDDLVENLSIYFDYFDRIAEKYGLEKIKTIGDSYMFATGIPDENGTHAIDCVLAGLEILEFIQDRKESSGPDRPAWDVRIGINSGPAVAGVIGKKRFAFDIWGATVNYASRMETHGEIDRVNISQSTYDYVKDIFDCTSHGEYSTGNGKINMYLVNGLKNSLKSEKENKTYNRTFYRMYKGMQE